jgi:hypothetical protein
MILEEILIVNYSSLPPTTSELFPYFDQIVTFDHA